MSDSYFKEDRIRELISDSTVEGCKLLELAPHAVKAQNGFHQEVPTSKALLLNLSRGTLTMRRVLQRRDYIKAWALFRADMTMISLGACDIITEGKRYTSPASDFPEELLTFMLRLKEEAI